MPLASRVAPDGSLIATPARGLFMGNRGGRFHDPATRTLRRARFAGKAWICCLLAFKDRPSPGVWGERRYTELFFCDEVTALAAGHRPCVECRRASAHAWRAAIVATRGLAEVPLFPILDAALHAERLEGRDKRMHEREAGTLPDGAAIRAPDGRFLVLRGRRALVWMPEGYAVALPRPAGRVAVLTPPANLDALSGGYAVAWHPSADRWADRPD